MENPRTETARANDDSDLIENAEPAPAGQTTSGGNLQRLVGAEDEERSVDDPAGQTRVTKDDAITSGESYRSGKTGD